MSVNENKYVEQIRQVLDADYPIITFTQTTHTAQDAADAIGCSVGQIAKSLIFKTRENEQPILVIASGISRVDERKVSRILGEKIARADADFVKQNTGFSIGGVPPVGHKTPPITLLDENLQNYDAIWAAAGSPNSVFKLSPKELPKLTGSYFTDVAK